MKNILEKLKKENSKKISQEEKVEEKQRNMARGAVGPRKCTENDTIP